MFVISFIFCSWFFNFGNVRTMEEKILKVPKTEFLVPINHYFFWICLFPLQSRFFVLFLMPNEIVWMSATSSLFKTIASCWTENFFFKVMIYMDKGKLARSENGNPAKRSDDSNHIRMRKILLLLVFIIWIVAVVVVMFYAYRFS